MTSPPLVTLDYDTIQYNFHKVTGEMMVGLPTLFDQKFGTKSLFDSAKPGENIVRNEIWDKVPENMKTVILKEVKASEMKRRTELIKRGALSKDEPLPEKQLVSIGDAARHAAQAVFTGPNVWAFVMMNDLPAGYRPTALEYLVISERY